MAVEVQVRQPRAVRKQVESRKAELPPSLRGRQFFFSRPNGRVTVVTVTNNRGKPGSGHFARSQRILAADYKLLGTMLLRLHMRVTVKKRGAQSKRQWYHRAKPAKWPKL